MRAIDWRFVFPLLIAALVCAGCDSAEPGQVEASSLDPVRLLAERPRLPATYMTDDGSQRIDWGQEPLGGRSKLRTCRDGKGAFRSWSDGAVQFGVPSVAHAVCTFGSEKAARDTYASQSLLEVGGNDWPNFEPYAKDETVPTGVRSLDVLAADEWEIGCGIGEPDSGCTVWTFRARYGRVLTKVEFTAGDGAIRFEQMRALVKSIDSVIAIAADG